MSIKKMRIHIPACHQVVYIILALVLLHSGTISSADKVPEFITLTFENDFFVGDDDGYSHGMGITFGQGPFDEFNNENLPDWLHWFTKDIYISTMPNKQRGVAHMFFQRMQTPERIEKTGLIKNDFPYAGLLAWQGTLYAWDDQMTDQFSLYLGAVGPVTLAHPTQSMIHKLMHSNEPKGWHNQIQNEFIFKIEFQRVWSLYRSDTRPDQIDILGLWGAGIGNLESATKAGIAIRWGTNLQHSVPTFSLQADRQINPLALTPDDDYYVFFGARVGVVFNNILIEGNTFVDSHSLPLEHYQDQLSTGIVWSVNSSAFVFQVSSISSGTKLNSQRDNFGALSVTFHF